MGQEENPSTKFEWDIRHKGRAWSREEWDLRRELTPEKIELSRGKLFWTDEDRLFAVAYLVASSRKR